MRKYVPFTVTFAILAIFTPIISFSRLNAQTDANIDQPAVVKDVEGLRAEFKQLTQDPDSKNATFQMILKSSIDSDRVKIEWTITGASKLVNDNDKRTNLTIKKGQTYTIPITIIPQGEGVTEVFGTAEAVNVDSSYLVTVRKNFATNKSAEILPITSDYTNAKNLSVVKNIILLVVVVATILGVILLILRRITKYLKTEPEVTFENELASTQDPNTLSK